MGQKEMVLRYLKENGSITTLEAFTKLFICDLQKIIQLLRKEYKITDTWIYKRNIYGRKIKFKKYFLEEE